MDYDRNGFATAPDGTRIFFGVRGPGAAGESADGAAGPTFVLCDGIGCDGFVWRYLQPHLAERHRVVHYHYRAHGRSALPIDAARIDIPAHARDLVAVLDALKIERAILVGHSMGTQVALETYRLEPARVEGLALLCGSYGKITATFRGSDTLKQALPSILEAIDKQPELARALWARIPIGLTRWIAQLSRDLDRTFREEDYRFYMEHVVSMDPSIFFAMLRLAGEHTAEDVLARIAVPTLVIAAELDTFTPSRVAEEMAAAIPGAELHVLRGARHAAPVEQPQLIEEHLDRWLGEHFARGAEKLDRAS